MYAIETKYLGPTNTKGARIRVTMGEQSRFYPYDSSRDLYGAHRAALSAFIDAANQYLVNPCYPLPGAKASDFAQASTAKGDGCVFIFVAFGWKGHDSD